MIIEIYAILFFVTVQLQGMQQETIVHNQRTNNVKTEKLIPGTPEEEYIQVAKWAVDKITTESQNKHLIGFFFRFQTFLDRIDLLKKKDILKNEKGSSIFVGVDNYDGLNGSLFGPCFVGLKYRIYTDLKYMYAIKDWLGDGVDRIIVGGFVWDEDTKKDVVAVESILKKDRQLFSDEFHHEIYPIKDTVNKPLKQYTGNYISKALAESNKHASQWNYLGGKALSSSYGKEEIEKEEQGLIEKGHTKFGNILLIPGISPITTQNLHSKLLAIATSCYLVKTVGMEGYKQYFNNRLKKRFPELNIGVENVSDFDMTLKIVQKIKTDVQHAQQLSTISESNDTGYNYKTFKKAHDVIDKSWNESCKHLPFPDKCVRDIKRY